MKSKKSIGIIVGVLVAVSIGAYMYLAPKDLPVVEAYKVDKGSVIETFEETAEVVVDKHQYVYTKVGGNVKNFDHKVGDEIKVGDTVAEIDTEVLELEIKGLMLDIEALNATYLEALRKSDKERVYQAQANIRAAKATYDESTRSYDNNKSLYDEGALSLDALNKSENVVKINKESYNVSLNELNLLTKSLSANQKVQYESQISSLESKLEILQRNLNNASIVAKNSGVILETFVNEGEVIQIGQPFIEIGSKGNLTVRSDVLTSDSINIEAGTKVMLRDEDNGLSLDGLVTLVYPKAFSKVSDLGITQKRITVEIFVSNLDNLKIGYELDSKFVVNTKEDVIRMPGRAVFELDNVDTVFVIEEGMMTLKAVEIGLKGDDYVEILSGIGMDDLVVLSVEGDLEEGSEVAYELEK